MPARFRERKRTRLYRAGVPVCFAELYRELRRRRARGAVPCVPVLTTDATPWAHLSGLKCGWTVPVGVEGLTEVIESVAAMDPSELNAMGERGRAYVEQVFSWPRIAAQMSEHYQSIKFSRNHS